MLQFISVVREREKVLMCLAINISKLRSHERDISWIYSISKVENFVLFTWSRGLFVQGRLICFLVYFIWEASACWRKVNCLHVLCGRNILHPATSSYSKLINIIYDYISRVRFETIGNEFYSHENKYYFNF